MEDNVQQQCSNNPLSSTHTQRSPIGSKRYSSYHSSVCPGNFRDSSRGGRRIVQRTTAKQHSCAACTSRSGKDDSRVQLMTQHHRSNESLHTLQWNGKINRETFKWETVVMIFCFRTISSKK